jgi:hypothetical protein
MDFVTSLKKKKGNEVLEVKKIKFLAKMCRSFKKEPHTEQGNQHHERYRQQLRNHVMRLDKTY